LSLTLLHGTAEVHSEEATSILLAWNWEPTVVLGLVAALLGYGLLAWRLYATHGRFDGRAAIAWVFGLLAVTVALMSPLDALADTRLLSAHMVQHGLLMSVAPPLLLLGLYPRLVVPVTRPIMKPLLRDRRTHAVLKAASSPGLALGIWLVVLYAWHVPTLYQWALRNEVVHIVEHVFFIHAGLLFWLPVIEPVPTLTRMKLSEKLAYLAVAQVGTGVLAAIMIWGPPLYPFYESSQTFWGLSTVADQRVAGLTMMVMDMLPALSVAGWILFKSLTVEERRERSINRKEEAWRVI
jgi:putative membrane protein